MNATNELTAWRTPSCLWARRTCAAAGLRLWSCDDHPLPLDGLVAR